MSFFEVIVLTAAVTGLVFMAAMVCGLIRGTYLKSRKKDQEEKFMLRIQKGELQLPKPGSSIEVPK